MRQPRHLVLDCPFCRMRVRGEAGDAMEYGGEGEQEIRVTLVRCPGCSYPLVAYEEACDYEQVDFDKYKTIRARRRNQVPATLTSGRGYFGKTVAVLALLALPRIRRARGTGRRSAK